MKIAVGICTYKRPDLLERLLVSLRNIQLGALDRRGVRIIVVDNFPDGRAREVCERVSEHLPIGLDFIEERKQGSSFARNRAIDEALDRHADFIAFLDDDDVPERDWLLHLVEKQKETSADIVYGVFPPAVDPEWPEWLRKSPLFDEPKYKARTKYGAPSSVGTGNVLLCRQILERLRSEGPLFLTEFGMLGCEDADFFARAERSGAKFSRAEKARVNRSYEDRRLTFGGLLKDAFRIGNCIRQLLDKYGTSAQRKQRKKKAFKKLLLAFLSLPLRVYSMTRLVRSLYRLSTELGVLRGYGGKK